MMAKEDEEEKLLRSVALQNARSILLARQRAEQELIEAKDALEIKTLELARSLAMLAATLESTTDGILVTDGRGRVTGYNRRFFELWGLSPALMEEDQERRILGLIAKLFDDPPTFRERIESIYASAPPETYDLLELEDGRVLERFSRIQSVEQAHMGRVWSFRDITARKQAEERLRQSEDRFRAIFDQAAVGMAIARLDGRFEQVNQRFTEILGYNAEELYQRSIAEVTYQEDLPETEGYARRLLAGEISHYVLEKRYVRSDGAVVWSLATVTLLKDAQGKPQRFIGVIEDIGLRKQTEEALLGSEARLHLAMEAGQMGAWEWILASGEVTWSSTLEAIHGLGPGAFGGRLEDFERYIHPGDRERVFAKVEASLAQKADLLIEYRVIKANGALAWIEARGKPFFDRQDNPERLAGICMDVTSRKHAEAALRKSEEFSRSIIESSGDCIKTLGLDGVLVWISERGRKALCLGEVDQVLGKSWLDFWQREDRAAAEAALRAAAQGGTGSFVGSLAVQTQTKWWDVVVTPMLDEMGKPERLLVVSRDVTEAKHARETSSRLAALVESSDDAIISKSLDGIILTWNQGAERMFGYRADEVIGQPITILSPPDRLDEMRGLLERLRRGERIEHHETVRARKDGNLLQVSLTVSPIKDSRGKTIGISKIARDITERKLAEQARELVGRLPAESPSPIVRLSREGMVSYANPAALRQLAGWELRIGHAAPGQILHLAAAEEKSDFDVACFERTYHVTVAPILPANYVNVYFTEITDLKVAEAKRRESEARFRALADNIAQFAWMADPHGWIFWYNRRWFDYTGSTPEEMAGWGWQKVHHPDHLERVVAKFRKHIERGEVWEDTFPLRGRDGNFRWFLSRALPIRDETGKVLRWFGTNTDITEQREAEQIAERARDQALAASRAKDDFVAALSHELRTPLNPVLLLASDAANDPRLPPVVREKFESIRKNAELEARLIDDLLDLTAITRGKLSIEWRSVDVHGVLGDVIDSVRSDARARAIHLEPTLAASSHVVWGDAVRLQQIFWNVLKNAVKFTPNGGRITIATNVPPDRAQLVVEITDSGIGMTAQELERVFSAFSQGDHIAQGGAHRFGGLGLGLAISQKLAELHQGRVLASSAGRDQGATFTIELPLPTSEEEKARAGSPADRTQAGPGAPSAHPGAPHSILLVEDHEATRTALAQILIRRGYKVVTAATLTAARALALSNPVDLLISDIGLPDGSGYDLMSELRGRHGLKGIALTGYGMETDIERSKAAGFVCHLTKPVRVQALEAALRAAETDLFPEAR